MLISACESNYNYRGTQSDNTDVSSCVKEVSLMLSLNDFILTGLIDFVIFQIVRSLDKYIAYREVTAGRFIVPLPKKGPTVFPTEKYFQN